MALLSTNYVATHSPVGVHINGRRTQRKKNLEDAYAAVLEVVSKREQKKESPSSPIARCTLVVHARFQQKPSSLQCIEPTIQASSSKERHLMNGVRKRGKERPPCRGKQRNDMCMPYRHTRERRLSKRRCAIHLLSVHEILFDHCSVENSVM
jgi:hypothetical protein